MVTTGVPSSGSVLSFYSFSINLKLPRRIKSILKIAFDLADQVFGKKENGPYLNCPTGLNTLLSDQDSPVRGTR